MRRRIVFRPAAEADLATVYAYIRDRNADPTIGIGYIRRIREMCANLAEFPQRGTRHEELGPGLRTIGFERRVTILFRVTPDTVEIIRVLYGGRDLKAAVRT